MTEGSAARHRSHRGAPSRWMDAVRRDTAHAFRTMRRAPAFTATVIVTLALGIGVNATLFSLADAVMFRPFPFANPDALVIGGKNSTAARTEISYRNFADWRDQSHSFAALTAMGSTNWTSTLRHDEPFTLTYRGVSGDWFDLLGARAMLGRTLSAEDDVRGAPRVIVLGYGLWQRRFGGRADVIGSPVTMDDAPFTIVGVMPREFGYPIGADAWTPLVPVLASIRVPGLPDLLENRGAAALSVVGRLRSGISIDAARQDLDALSIRLATTYGQPRQVLARLTPLTEQLLGQARLGLWAMLGAVGLLLLAALANVTGLMLVRVSKRRSEFAVRFALGASRAAVARQMLLENACLALLATVLALLIARVSLPAVLAWLPAIPRVDAATVDLRVAGFAAVVGLVTSVLCSVAPLITLRRHQLAGAMRSGGYTGTRTLANPARQALVVFEVAVAVVLLVGAGLLLRSVTRVGQVDIGFDAPRLLAATLDVPAVATGDRIRTNQFYQRAIDALAEVPGVEVAGAAMSRPLKGPIGLDSAWQFQGQSGDASQANPWANVETVTPGYFAAMGMRLLEGRLLDTRDAEGGQRAVLISRSLAQYAWPWQSAIGRQLRTAALDAGEVPRWWTVVGVVGDVRYRELASVPLDVYVSAAQSPFIAGDLMVRLSEPVERMAPLVRARLREVNPDGAITIDVMGDVLAAHRAPWTANMALFGLFAGLTLVIAVIGLYALMASTVSERVREIAVRLTLGATPGGILTELIWFGARLTGSGVLLGIIGALAGGGVVRSLLFEVSPIDASTLTAAPALLVLVALLACLIPSLRASRTDPAITLRSE